MSYLMSDFLKDLCEKDIDPNDEIFRYLSRTDVARLSMLRKRLERVRAYAVPAGVGAKARKGKKARLTGALFERLVRVLIDGCNVFAHDGNIRSTISEIDFRIQLQPTSNAVPILRNAGPHILGEAKCLTSGLRSEWINELAGLLPVHGANTAILFTASPSKKLRADHRTAIAIQAARGAVIVPFGLKQIGEVESGGNFLALLSVQHLRSTTHSTDLDI